MDGSRFDAFTRSLGAAGSRRRLLAGITGAAAGMLGWEAATAKPHGGKCLTTGKRCTPTAAGAGHDAGTDKSKRKGKHKPPSCATCCTGVGAPNANGKHVCACKAANEACGATAECCSGQCRDSICTDCPADKAVCGGACVDLQTDHDHCGDCDTPCNPGQRCAAGACICDTTSGCDGCCDGATCRDGKSDGACGGNGEACVVCQAPDTCAGGGVGHVCGCTDDGKACDGTQCGNVRNSCGQTVNCDVETCAGYQTANSNVTCSNNGVCTFSCQGENYDVNGDKSDGCEATDADGGNHTVANAKRLNAQSCFDTERTTFTGQILSDGRVHESPAIVGFDSTTGSAPDYWVVNGTGGTFCQNDPKVTITMTGGTAGCYKLTIITDTKTASTPVDGNGTATVTMSSGSYTGGTDIVFKIEKTCGTNVKETVDYSVKFNL